MNLSNTNNSSTRSDSTQSQSVFSEMFPDGVFLTYAPEDCDYEMRWYGGAYIECDDSAEFRGGREFTCQEIINVYDYATSEVTISTLAEFAEECETYILQEREARSEECETYIQEQKAWLEEYETSIQEQYETYIQEREAAMEDGEGNE